MPKKPRSLNRFTPQQLLVVLILLLAVAIYQYWSRSPDPATLTPPTDTPQLVTVDHPTITPEQSPPPTETSGHAESLSPTDTPDIPPAESMGDFDYFVLSLSWSPDYCASNGNSDLQQCSIGKKLGFVLHGLWPQYNQGYPSNCSTEKLPAGVKAQYAGLYPSDSLINHEWEKHGTCSGLSPASYLALSQQMKDSVFIPAKYRSPEAPFRASPDQLKRDFIQVNPGFAAANFGVYCSSSGRYLKELYVCLSKEGDPIACGADVRKDAAKSCQKADFLVRNTR